MGGYTVVRVSEVANVAAGRVPEEHFELRMLRDALGCQGCAVSYERLGAGWKPARGHRHRRQEEVYVLVSGRALAKLDDEVVELEPWTALRVPPETVRALRATGGEDAVFVTIGAPNTGPGDGEFVDDFWTD